MGEGYIVTTGAIVQAKTAFPRYGFSCLVRARARARRVRIGVVDGWKKFWAERRVRTGAACVLVQVLDAVKKFWARGPRPLDAVKKFWARGPRPLVSCRDWDCSQLLHQAQRVHYDPLLRDLVTSQAKDVHRLDHDPPSGSRHTHELASMCALQS
jgi:hypothetical protein